jgi:hypothetical protein
VVLPDGPGGPVVYEYLSDTVIWSGALLGAECERWAATRDPAALERAGRLLGGLETLAAVTGRLGLLARYACPEGFLGKVPHPDEWRDAAPAFPGWRWRGDLSKDQLAGLVYGLAAVVDLVPDRGCRARAARLLGDVSDRVLGRGDALEEAWGRPTTYGDVHHHVKGFPVGVNAAVALGLADAAARATGDARHRRRFERLVAEGACDALRVPTIRIFGRENFNNSNLAALALASVLRVPPDPEDGERAEFRAGAEGALRRILELHRGEGNSFWIAIAAPAGEAAGFTGAELCDARTSLARYPAELVGRALDLRGRSDYSHAFWGSKRGRPQLVEPLPLDERGPDSFCWKDNPYESVRDPGAKGIDVYSGADFLAAYWPLRRMGYVHPEE